MWITFCDIGGVGKQLKPVRGARVRLNHDVSTRGGRVFRAGVVMRVGCTDRGYYLTVRVRGKTFALMLQKREYPRTFAVISVPGDE